LNGQVEISFCFHRVSGERFWYVIFTLFWFIHIGFFNYIKKKKIKKEEKAKPLEQNSTTNPKVLVLNLSALFLGRQFKGQTGAYQHIGVSKFLVYTYRVLG
jgi:hypothetical protein